MPSPLRSAWTPFLIGAALLIGTAGLVRYTNGAPAVALDVPFVTTPHMAVDRMLEMAEVGPDDYVIDLGSGDGRIVIAAARDYGARGLGVDIDPVRISESRDAAIAEGVADRVEFRQEDLFVTDIDEATVVTMYLLSTVNMRLRPRILQELDPGTRVVSHTFQMGEWQADEMTEVAGSLLYLWIVPADVDGNWRLTGWGGEAIDLSFSQEFQRIEGIFWRGNGAMPLAEASLRGDEIRFVLDEAGPGARAFEGRIVDGTIVPRDETETWRMAHR